MGLFNTYQYVDVWHVKSDAGTKVRQTKQNEDWIFEQREV